MTRYSSILLQSSTKAPVLALLAAAPGDEAVATELALRLGLPLLPVGSDPVSCDEVQAVLVVAAGPLSLQRTGRGVAGPVAVDFGSAAMRHRRSSGHNELLGRAVGVEKKPLLRVLDATAGLGRDSFVLADIGCEVILCERHPVIVELLRCGMHTATGRGDRWLLQVLSRMRLLPGDVREQAPGELQGVDAIYLDPMFPPRSKSAAAQAMPQKPPPMTTIFLGSFTAQAPSWKDSPHWQSMQHCRRERSPIAHKCVPPRGPPGAPARDPSLAAGAVGSL